MPNYVVTVKFTYPVSAIDAKDALNTVDQVIRMRFIGITGEGRTEITDETGKTVLTAVLNPTDQSRKMLTK